MVPRRLGSDGPRRPRLPALRGLTCPGRALLCWLQPGAAGRGPVGQEIVIINAPRLFLFSDKRAPALRGGVGVEKEEEKTGSVVGVEKEMIEKTQQL